MEEQIKKFQHIAPLCEYSEVLIRLYPMATVYVRAIDHDAALADKDARIIELEAERDEWRRLFNSAGVLTINALTDRDAVNRQVDNLIAKIEGLETASCFACGLADELRALIGK